MDDSEGVVFRLLLIKPPLIIVTRYYKDANHLAKRLGLPAHDWIWGHNPDNLRYFGPDNAYTSYRGASIRDVEINELLRTLGLRYISCYDLLKLVA